MKKKWLFLILILLIGFSGLYLATKEKVLTHEVNEIAYVELRESVSCEIVKKKITNISNEPRSVKGYEKHRFFLVEFNGEELVALITKNQDIVSDMDLLVAANCRSATIDEKAQLENQECFNLYYYNKNEKQVKLECGFILNDKAVFLK